jgi:hypothetical protein
MQVQFIVFKETFVAKQNHGRKSIVHASQFSMPTPLLLAPKMPVIRFPKNSDTDRFMRVSQKLLENRSRVADAFLFLLSTGGPSSGLLGVGFWQIVSFSCPSLHSQIHDTRTRGCPHASATHMRLRAGGRERERELTGSLFGPHYSRLILLCAGEFGAGLLGTVSVAALNSYSGCFLIGGRSRFEEGVGERLCETYSVLLRLWGRGVVSTGCREYGAWDEAPG